jgi:hypothetical protein
VGATSTGFISIAKGDEVKMKTVIATIGPLSVAFYASDIFMNYQRGIYDEPNCSTSVNHGVSVKTFSIYEKQVVSSSLLGNYCGLWN